MFKVLVTAGCMLVAWSALAAGDTPALVEVEDDAAMVTSVGMNVDSLEELDVVGANGEEIGDVEEVLADSSGKVVAVVVEYGGFLNMGEKEAVFMLDKLKLQNGKLVTTMTKGELEALPNWTR
ncbi:MAG: PRC-barrel domain-containing protein [Sphingomonadales bacterium]